MGKLEGKVAIVSGSGRGIGRAVALKLAAEGASVVINDLDAAPAEQTVAEIAAGGGKGVACIGSVTAPDFAERFVQTAITHFGGLDIIVNNAGYTWDNVVQKMTDEQWYAMIDVHLTAPFRILRASADFLRNAAKEESEAGQEKFRKVVNVSSIAGVGGNAGQVNYAAAKAGVIGMTRTLAKEWTIIPSTTPCCCTNGCFRPRWTYRSTAITPAVLGTTSNTKQLPFTAIMVCPPGTQPIPL